MRVKINRKRVFELIDVLLARWRSEPKQYPFNRHDALLPQAFIHADLRRDKHLLACFYFYVCIYMRGGIESLQAFKAMERMWRAHPYLFDPMLAQGVPQKDVQKILKKYVGWDSESASISWVENSKHLFLHWNGDPLNLVRGIKTYEAALGRIRNKRTKKEIAEMGEKRRGFRGFQEKMVSMLLYFYDYEGWLPSGFIYPSPADFHNFRLGFATGAITVIPWGNSVRVNKKISAAWRAAVVAYIRKFGVDPKEVSDVLWLFSLVMCGNSPATKTVQREAPASSGLFKVAHVKEEWKHDNWLRRKRNDALKKTCLICPLAHRCDFAIPSWPYYRRGIIKLRPREKLIEAGLNHIPEPAGEVEEDLQQMFDL